jgi:hypothetical protein
VATVVVAAAAAAAAAANYKEKEREMTVPTTGKNALQSIMAVAVILRPP